MWNKRGQDVMSLYWFLILAVIAGGIFAMVYVFYGTPFDVREIEANILTNKISDCVSYGGKISSNIIADGVFQPNSNFLGQCHLTFISNEWEDQQFYSEINFYKIGDLENSVFRIKEGDNKWLPYCSLGNEEDLVKCFDRSFYSVDDLNNQYIIKILSVVRKSEKNVKI